MFYPACNHTSQTGSPAPAPGRDEQISFMEDRHGVRPRYILFSAPRTDSAALRYVEVPLRVEASHSPMHHSRPGILVPGGLSTLESSPDFPKAPSCLAWNTKRRSSFIYTVSRTSGCPCHAVAAAFCGGMGRIADESIQQVIATVNIVDVISAYFPLKRAGVNFTACCPFHTERTPSFNVSPAKNLFHCFGCGKGGNVITFVKEYESLPFAEAVRKLAAKYGITLIEEAGPAESEEKTALRVRLLALHRDIAEWFHQLLLKSPLAQDARAYLTKRGLSTDVAKGWLIGYAPADPPHYRGWMAERGYPESLLVQGGIYSPREEGNPERGGYPRFKHRVMFPIRNDHGDVIAFSGRILDVEASPAKYMNSPATPIFSKSEVFFGLDKSKSAIHKAESAVICEGQIDMITCYEHGIRNIVAPLGTAFTPEHARLLKRHTEQVVLCFDSDNAGCKAAQSCFTELAKEGLYVRVASLPIGDDPDSLIRRDGVESLRAHLSGAKDFLDWQIDLRLPSVDPGNLRDRMKLLSDITGSIAKIRDRMAQDAAINRAAMRLSAPVDELRRMVTAHAKTMLRNREQAEVRSANAAAREEPSERTVLEIDNPAVRQLLKLALTCPEAHQWMAQQKPSLPWTEFAGGDLIDRALQAGIDPARPESVAAWLSTLSPEEEPLVSAIMHDNSPPGGVESAARTALSLEVQSTGAKLAVLKSRQRQPDLPQEQAMSIAREIALLQNQYLDLQKKVRDIQLTR
jgi:DNA primase